MTGSLNVEILLSHKTGISDSYYRPTENELFQDYSKSVDSLTIQKDQTALQEQITEMEEKRIMSIFLKASYRKVM